MNFLFIGGPCDGELRDVPEAQEYFGRAGFVTTDGGAYHIANGIARHESVPEDEVARRVHGLMRLTSKGAIADIRADLSRGFSIPEAIRNAVLENDERQRYMVPQVPPEARGS